MGESSLTLRGAGGAMQAAELSMGVVPGWTRVVLCLELETTLEIHRHRHLGCPSDMLSQDTTRERESEERRVWRRGVKRRRKKTRSVHPT